MRTCVLVLLILFCCTGVLHFAAGIPPVVRGEEYTFHAQPGNNSWGSINNWDPATGPPQAGDTAIIPNQELCIVDDSEAAQVVEVQSGGTLRIDGKTLTIAYGSGAAGLTVNGTLEFRTVNNEPGTLRYDNTDSSSNVFVIGGSGILKAVGTGHSGIIRGHTTTTGLKIDTNVILEGSLDIRKGSSSLGITMDGTCRVNSSADAFKFETSSSAHNVYGSGTYAVSAGTMKIGLGNRFAGEVDSLFEVSGGTLVFAGTANQDYVGDLNQDCLARFEISGGEVIFRRFWVSRGGLELTGDGMITVSPLRSVAFIPEEE